jgi:transcriptional regulator with XRE-family HTH domain/molybdopterin converting factor small subunit
MVGIACVTLQFFIQKETGGLMTPDASTALLLKGRRQELGLSLRELGRRTDLSASFLSLVEHNQSGLSLASMWRIADALEMSLASLLSDQASVAEALPSERVLPGAVAEVAELDGCSPVVRAGRRARQLWPSSSVVCELLTPAPGRKLEALCGRLAPRTPKVAHGLREPAEELIYVLAGALQVELGDREYTLRRGDTIYFCGGELQRIACASETEAVVWLSVSSQ